MQTSKKYVLFTNIRSLKIERVVPIEEAIKLGYEVVLMSQNKVSGLDDLIQHYILVENPFDHEACLKKIVEFHQEHPLSGVFSWTDRDVELVSKVGEVLGLKTLSVKASKLVRNKYEMRKALDTIPGLCPPFFPVSSLDNLKKAMRAIKGPAVFKPVGASGSTAIIKLDTHSNLEEAYKKMLDMTDIKKFPMCGFYKNEYICEEYIDGPEVSVDGFVDQGKIHIFGVTDKDVTSDYSLEYNSYFPSSKPKEVIMEIKEKTELALNSLELDNAPFHLEGRYTSLGFMILECAGRCGGGFIVSHLIPYATGRSGISEVIKMGVGLPTEWDRSDTKVECHAGMWDNLPEKQGTVVSVKGIEEALEVKGIKYAISWLQVGDKAILPPTSYACIESTVIGTAENRKNLNEMIDKARRKIIVEVG
jgi:biotin carboxylase